MMKQLLFFMMMTTMLSCGEHLTAQEKKIIVSVGQKEFPAILYDNQAGGEFAAMLPITVNMIEMGGYEKYHNLPQNLSGTPSRVESINEGDLMIWSSNCLVLFYVTRATSYSYIRLGKITDTNGLRAALGAGNVEVTFRLEEVSLQEPRAQMDQPYRILHAPEDGTIRVEGSFEKLTLQNLNGAVVAQSNMETVDTHHLATGVYLLKIESRIHPTHIQKVVVK